MLECVIWIDKVVIAIGVLIYHHIKKTHACISFNKTQTYIPVWLRELNCIFKIRILNILPFFYCLFCKKMKTFISLLSKQNKWKYIYIKEHFYLPHKVLFVKLQRTYLEHFKQKQIGIWQNNITLYRLFHIQPKSHLSWGFSTENSEPNSTKQSQRKL